MEMLVISTLIFVDFFCKQRKLELAVEKEES